MAWLRIAIARSSASAPDQFIFETASSPFVPILTSQLPGLHFLRAAMSAGGWSRPFRSSSFAGVEKRPISGICGNLPELLHVPGQGKELVHRPQAVFTTPKAAISGLSVVGRSFVTTSPFSMAASCASSSWITFRRNGRGGASCASATRRRQTAQEARQEQSERKLLQGIISAHRDLSSRLEFRARTTRNRSPVR